MKLSLLFLLPSLAFADGKITNADIYSGAAIVFTKMQTRTANNVCTFDSSGYVSNGVARGDLTAPGTDGIAVTGGSSSVLGSGTSIAQHVADSTHNGYLSSTDWNTFNGKQAAGNYITALTGDVTASGPGSAAATLATVNSNVGSFTNGSFTVNAKGLITAASSGTAPVTSLTVASANGFAGSFSASATPVLTMSTTVSGNVCGNGTALSACSTTGSNATVLATSPTIVTPTIAKIANLTTNGYVKTSGSDGTLGVQAVPIPVADGGTGQTTYTDGQLLIGNTTGNTLAKATLTQGTGISITNGAGSITIASTVTNGVTCEASGYVPTTASCVWGRSSSTMGAFGADADCNVSRVVDIDEGQCTAQTTASQQPAMTFNNVPAGTCTVTVTLMGGPDTAGEEGGYTINDGTTTSPLYVSGVASAGNTPMWTMQAKFVYASSGNRTYEVYGYVTANNIQIVNQSNNRRLSFRLQCTNPT